MKNTLKDNCYLENIVRSVDWNMREIQHRTDVDKIGMLKYVIKHCNKRIEEMENENGNNNT